MKIGRISLFGTLLALFITSVGMAATPALAQLSAPGMSGVQKPRAPKVLTIPEPSTYALAAGAASLVLCAWVKRRR